MSALNLAADALIMQQTLHAALANDLAVTAALGDPIRAFDDTPDDPVYPYLTYGQIRSEDTSGDAAPQSTHQMTLHLWSRYAGRAEVFDLLRMVFRYDPGQRAAHSLAALHGCVSRSRWEDLPRTTAPVRHTDIGDNGMTATHTPQRGRDMLLKIEDGGAYSTVAGLRTKSIRMNSQTVDVTDQASNGWTELLPEAGIRSVSVTGSGVF